MWDGVLLVVTSSTQLLEPVSASHSKRSERFPRLSGGKGNTGGVDIGNVPVWPSGA